jgi:hypothetical protein
MNELNPNPKNAEIASPPKAEPTKEEQEKTTPQATAEAAPEKQKITAEQTVAEFEEQTNNLKEQCAALERRIKIAQEQKETNLKMSYRLPTVEQINAKIDADIAQLTAEKEKIANEINERGPNAQEQSLQQDIEKINEQIARLEKTQEQNQGLENIGRGMPAVITERLKQDIEALRKQKETKQQELEKKKLERILNYYNKKVQEKEQKEAGAAEKADDINKAITDSIEAVKSNLPEDKKQELTEKKKSFVSAVKEKLKGVRVFGKPLLEFLAGIATGGAVRTAIRMAAIGGGGLVTPIVAGAAGGAATAGLREFFQERRNFNKFKESLQEKIKDSEKSAESIAQTVAELKEQLANETDPKKREALSDQLRYLFVEIKRTSKTEKTDLKSKVEQLVKLHRNGITSETGANPNEQEELFNQIVKAKKVDRKKLAKAILRGTICGALGGAVGGLIADWLGGMFTPTHEPYDVSSEALSAYLGPGSVPSLNPETVYIANDLVLKAGSNPWQEVAQYLQNLLGHKPTNAEILKVTKEIANTQNIKVPEWGITQGIDEHSLPIGFQLKFAPTVKSLIQSILEGKKV